MRAVSTNEVVGVTRKSLDEWEERDNYCDL